MRVIAGRFRGLKLNEPKDDKLIRPTTDRIKEDIFNILSLYIPGSTFLDLYSGTGAIAIEAVSRGAEYAHMVERSNESIKIMTSNIQKTKCEDEFVIIKSDVNKFLSTTRNKYDIIFLDPPYKLDNGIQIVQTILERDILNDDGIIVVECAREYIMPEKIGRMKLFRQKSYSHTNVYFYDTEEDN